jgi:hypothetical protein
MAAAADQSRHRAAHAFLKVRRAYSGIPDIVSQPAAHRRLI